ncbi:nucleoside 2-deoxyribosyltransferase protein [Salmonella phage SB5]|uniref:Nucleoside 2-deoxyribosyltransferase protein n=2 Tax=root TaxID=1 RepID=A0AAX4CZG5_9CAUD
MARATEQKDGAGLILSTHPLTAKQIVSATIREFIDFIMHLGHLFIRVCLFPQRVVVLVINLILFALRASCPPDAEEGYNENERRKDARLDPGE